MDVSTNFDLSKSKKAEKRWKGEGIFKKDGGNLRYMYLEISFALMQVNKQSSLHCKVRTVK